VVTIEPSVAVRTIAIIAAASTGPRAGTASAERRSRAPIGAASLPCRATHRRPISRCSGVWRGAQFRPPDLVNRVLDPGLRHSLGTAELAQLSEAIASSLHLVYILAGLAAAATLVLACASPRELSLTRPLEGSEVSGS
jgi:hypothetical protein